MQAIPIGTCNIRNMLSASELDFGAQVTAFANYADSSVYPTYGDTIYHTDGGPLATYAFASAQVLGNMSWATADLSTGYLHVYGSTLKPVKQDPTAWIGATTNASSDARFSDVIWFDIPTGSIERWSRMRLKSMARYQAVGTPASLGM
jgi:hypothetical protein